METLIIILIIIGLIIWLFIALIPFFSFLFVLIILTLIVFGMGAALLFLSLFLFSISEIRRLRSEGNLAKVIDVVFDGEKLSWFVDEILVKDFAKPQSACSYGITIGFITMVFTVICLWGLGYFQLDFYKKEIPESVALFIFSIISFIASIIIISKYYPDLTYIFECWTFTGADKLMNRVEKKIEKLGDLLSLEDFINSEASKMEVTFPIDIQIDIQDFVDSRKMEILSDVTELNKFILKKINQAENDLAELQKKNDLYQTAMEMYNETVHEVNKTESISLIKKLDYIYYGLTSSNLKTLVSDRKWNEFNDVVNLIIGELEGMSKKALKYLEDGYEAEIEEYDDETDEEKACKILGVPSTASPDQIKRVYRALSTVWHTDKGNVEDDKRMKGINWAYDILKDSKNFA